MPLLPHAVVVDKAVRQRFFWYLPGFNPYGPPGHRHFLPVKKVRKGVVAGRVLGWRTPGGVFAFICAGMCAGPCGVGGKGGGREGGRAGVFF